MLGCIVSELLSRYLGMMGVWEKWTIDVRESLGESPAILQKDVFYGVPSCLKNDQTRLFYHPKQISFGPRHFRLSGRTENLSDSENFKSEVTRRFNGQLRGGIMESLVEHFKRKGRVEQVQRNYGVEVIGRFPEQGRPDGLCWMLARDGCFLLQVLDGFDDERNKGQECSTELTVLQHILKRDNHHPLLNEIVKDMFKLENQLPLWVLQEILKALERDTDAYWFESALTKLSPIDAKGESAGSRTYRNRIHILQLLGEYMIDNKPVPPPPTDESRESEADNKSLLSGSRSQDGHRNHKKPVKYLTTILKGVFDAILVLVFTPVFLVWLIIWLMRESYQIYLRGSAEEDDLHVPTVEELHSIGVKFKSLKGKGISHIHFNASKLKLYLPKFTVDDRSEVILRNLLAMETQWEEEEKIITRYVVFMNDLVNTSVDVARLRRRGIIANKLGSDEDVARLWNSVTVPSTDIPRYDPIDKVSRSINAYRKKWWRVLSAQFWRLHCSKPWLLASLLGGITLLWLTVVQVICLFNRCSKSGIEWKG